MTTTRRAAVHAAGFVVGGIIGWVVVSGVWVRFDSILPMWITSAGLLTLGIGLLIWARPRLGGLGVGLSLSAAVFGLLFTSLSRGSMP